MYIPQEIKQLLKYLLNYHIHRQNIKSIPPSLITTLYFPETENSAADILSTNLRSKYITPPSFKALSKLILQRKLIFDTRATYYCGLKGSVLLSYSCNNNIYHTFQSERGSAELYIHLPLTQYS